MASLKLLAYAKVNLYLAVFKKRPDGYHDIKSVIQNISIFDEIHLEEAERLEVTSNLPIRPKENLVTKAAAVMMELANKKGIKITLRKNIAIAAGLGGGSSDAAAVIHGLNTLWDLKLPEETLIERARGLGSDIPFFIKGGTALIEDTGEKVSPLTNNAKMHFVIAKPGYGVRSHEAYHRFDKEEPPPAPPIEGVIKALEKGDVEAIAKNISNMLEPTVIKGHPQIELLKQAALKAGALSANLCGSGSSIFCLVDSTEQAKEVSRSLEKEVSDVYIAESRDFALETI